MAAKVGSASTRWLALLVLILSKYDASFLLDCMLALLAVNVRSYRTKVKPLCHMSTRQLVRLFSEVQKGAVCTAVSRFVQRQESTKVIGG
jgi:hypothetical protein